MNNFKDAGQPRLAGLEGARIQDVQRTVAEWKQASPSWVTMQKAWEANDEGK